MNRRIVALTLFLIGVTLMWNTSAQGPVTIRNSQGQEVGTLTNPLRVDTVGTTQQPVILNSTITVVGTGVTASDLLLNSTVTDRLPLGGSPTDAEPNTNTNLSRIGSFSYLFNSGTGKWDRQPGDATNGTKANITNSSLAVTQSGTWTDRIVGNAGATLDATVAAGAAPTNMVVSGLVYNSTELSASTTQSLALQSDANGRLRSVTMDGRGNFFAAGVTGDNNQMTQDASTGVVTSPVPPKGQYTAGQGNGGALIGLTICNKRANINTTANALLVSGVTGQNVYICQINLVAGAATNVALVEGTGALCATNTTGMMGGSSAATGWNLAANGGIVVGTGVGLVSVTTTTGENVCILVSAANQVSGSIMYAIY